MNMEIDPNHFKMVAAMHEAGHAVIAVKSKHHLICRDIVTDNSGAGITYVSRQATSPGNLEAAKEYAVILLAGFAVERKLRDDGDDVVPNRESAEPDYVMARSALQECGGDDNLLLECETKAHEAVVANWPDIEQIAVRIYDAGGCLDAVDVYEFLRIPIPAVRRLDSRKSE